VFRHTTQVHLVLAWSHVGDQRGAGHADAPDSAAVEHDGIPVGVRVDAGGETGDLE
jgi:hypothetical protein